MRLKLSLKTKMHKKLMTTKRLITSMVHELMAKKIFPDLEVKEEKNDNGKRVDGLLFMFSVT